MATSGDWDIKGKVCLVTGANCGLGRQTCLDFIKLGAGRVIMTCRNMETGQEAVKFIREKAGITDDGEAERRLALRQLDLASLESIRQFAAQINKEEEKLDVLVNNAGLCGPREKRLTKDGFELAFGTNHLGHFLLTKLLLDLLKKSAPARIVVVAAHAYMFCWPWGFHIDDPNYDKGGWYEPCLAYSQSKLANILFTRELDRRLNADGPSGVTVYSLHPGGIKTEVGRHRHWLLRLIINYTIFNPLFCSTIEQGVMTILYCATKPGIEQYSGRYFVHSQVIDTWAIAKDDVMATRLWDLSECLTSK